MLHVWIRAKAQCKAHPVRQHSTRPAVWCCCKWLAGAQQRAAQLEGVLRAAQRLGAVLHWHGPAESTLPPEGHVNVRETTNQTLRLEVCICVKGVCPHHSSRRYDLPRPTCAICRQLEGAQRRAMLLEAELRALELHGVEVQRHADAAHTVSALDARSEPN